jgi:uncharacterized protein (DUF1330 family)
MQRFVSASALVLLGIVIGVFTTNSVAEISSDESTGYLIVVGKTVDADGLGPYIEAAGSAISNAGLHRLARSRQIGRSQVLEGSWPYEGFVAIEQFESWERLSSYWSSDEFQKIKTLREGKIEIDFVVAVEALPASK